MKYHWLVTASSLVWSLAGPAQADSNQGFGHMWDGGYGMFGGLMMVVFWGLIIGLIVLAVRSFLGRSDSPASQSAMDILKERYARGEIDDEEFERRKAKIEG
ncbi:SHOCT domain-containing protein [Sulfitobacter sp. MF3-043]|uniref:SHOCT domain-containing protein n=1 Tax=Sulfitobacter sediminivivens TaxID=3252902 RepID=UPI0036DD082A